MMLSAGDEIVVWGHVLNKADLSQDECIYLSQLPARLPSVAWMWTEMNSIWQAYGLNNRKPLQGQAINLFYQHPVWLANGLFTMLDNESARHRNALAGYLADQSISRIADFGGGFGELAIAVSRKLPGGLIDVIEPYPRECALKRAASYPGIQFVADLGEDYDAVIAQDVLEHVEDPVGLAFRLAMAARAGGYVIFANCFYPVIACHLPATFYLRHTFQWVMRQMGLQFLGTIKDAPHVQIFRKRGPIDLDQARQAEKTARRIGGVINPPLRAFAKLRRMAAGQ